MKNPEDQALPAEKEIIIDLLRDIWARHPNVTFGQLISCLTGGVPHTALIMNRRTDLAEVRSYSPTLWFDSDETVRGVLMGVLYGQGNF